MKKIYYCRVVLCCLCLFISVSVFSQVNLSPFGSSWKYWANTQAMAPLPAWTGSGAFDDSAWPSGLARLGFGGDGEVTCIPAGTTCVAGCTPGGACNKYLTTYFRRVFNVVDKNVFSGLTVNLKRDDGAVIYINGTEVWRSNMPAGAISYTTVAATNVNAPDETATFTSPVISSALLVNGNNIIAVEVHQQNLASSDLGFDLELLGSVSNSVNVIPFGTGWRYQADIEANAPAGTTWTLAAFNDAAWPLGVSKLGFGGDGEVTCIPAGAAGCTAGCLPGGTCTKFTTTYFRKKFNITNLDNFKDFTINMVRDDGAVVYVNGVEVWRTNMPAGPVAYSTFATAVIGGVDETTAFASPVIPASAFLEGENTLAVEIHQVNSTSSDLGFNLELIGRYNILNYGDTWKYHANSLANAPAASWVTAGFNDAAWPSGLGKLGFGDDLEVTCIPAGVGCDPNPCLPGIVCTKYTTTYFRKKIIIDDVSQYSGFVLNMIRDDGAVVYINGVEAWRTNMPAGAITYSTYAPVNTVEGPDENAVNSSPLIPASFFVSGENTIAVEVHQFNDVSSDLGFDLEIISVSAPLVNESIYMWSGAIQPTSAKVNAKITLSSTQVRLAVSTDPAMASPVYGPYAIADAANNRVAALSITGLSPDTQYYYAIEADGIIDNSADDIGRFRTPPGTQAYNFSFTVGSCGLTGNHPVFTKMAANNPLINLMIGDFHYANPNSSTDINVHRAPYESFILSQTPSRNLFLNSPIAYVWDDHDYSGNDTDSTAAGKTNARLAYREYIPHYPMGAGAVADRPIYQSFTLGRVHFILTDLRSTRGAPTMMGLVQKAWFKNECLFARDNNKIIAWVSSVSFGGNQADNWGGFAAERTELSNFFRDNAITNMFIMSGDAHMSALDNGNNHDFASGLPNVNKYPVLAAAALNQSGSYKGGNYSEAGIVVPPNGTNNSYLNPNNTFGQYGLVEVTDAGGTQICIKFTIFRVTNNPVDPPVELVSYSFCRAMFSVVPVKISSFNARFTTDKKGAVVSWKTESEINCKNYVVEKSLDGIGFFPIAEIICKGGNLPSMYNFTDWNVVKGINYYRIRSVDQNGSSSVTETKTLLFGNSTGVQIFPNPVTDKISLRITNNQLISRGTYVIYNSLSQEQMKGNITLQAGNSTHEIPVKALNNGYYILRLQTGSAEIVEKFMIQK